MNGICNHFDDKMQGSTYIVPHLTKMLHEQEGRLLDPGTLPLAALDHDGHGVEVLLFGPGDDLHVVLVHDGPHVWAVGVGSRLKEYILSLNKLSPLRVYLETWHDW